MEYLKLNELTKKKLEETFIVIYAIKNEINIKKADIIEKNDIYTFIGVDIKGIRHLLNIYADKVNNSHFWLDVLEGLKSRGVKNILFLSVDNNKNMKRTAKIAFPNITFTDSLTSIYPKFYKYISERSSKNIAGKIKELYVQKTIEDYKNVFKAFSERYNNVIHKNLIKKYLNNVENTYKYSQNIRNLLFKHSANVQYYDKIRLTFDNTKYINNFEDLYDELDDNKYKYFGYTSFQKKEWTLILNDLIQYIPISNLYKRRIKLSKKKEQNKKQENKDVKDLIIDEAVKQFKEGKIQNSLDVTNFLDSLLQPLMQKLLDTELDNHLEYDKYKHQKDKKTQNSRNGHCKAKTVKTEYGNIEIETPRDRNATFEPVIIEKGQTRLTGFEDKCIALYAKGMSLIDIENTLWCKNK